MLILLFLIFMVLKLCGVIAWSWWLVCLPGILAVLWRLAFWGFIAYNWD